MRKFIVSLSAAIGFLACISMQAYLLILLTSTSIWAQTTEVTPPKEVIQKEVTKKEVVEKKTPATPKKEDKKNKIKEPDEDKDLNVKLHFGKGGFNMKIEDEEGKDASDEDDEGKINISGDNVNVPALLENLKDLERIRKPRSVLRELEEIIVPLGAFALTFGLVYMVFAFRARARREKIETIKMFVEKGQPIPENLFGDDDDRTTWLAQMQKGITLSAMGLGLGIFLATVDGPWAVGAILLFVGLGKMLAAKVKKDAEVKK